MKCKKCNTEFEGEFCPNCSAPAIQKAIYKKWWFWVIVGVASVFFIGMVAGIAEGIAQGSSDELEQTIPVVTLAEETGAKPVVNVSKYKKVTVDGLFSTLDANVMRAENDYKDKYVEFEAVITHIGTYGTVHVGAYSSSEDTIECYVDDEYNDFLMNKSKGDRVKIKGKITHVSATFGYTVEVDEISNVSN